MPEAVGRFVEDGTFTDVARFQKRLVLDYRADVRKYCENLDAARIDRQRLPEDVLSGTAGEGEFANSPPLADAR